MTGNWLFVGMTGCTNVGEANMAYVALALLILIPLILLIAGTALKRTPMLMIGGIAAFGVGVYCFAQTASTAGEYSDIYAIMGAVCFMLTALGVTGRLWLGEREDKVLEREEKAVTWADEQEKKDK